jgi:hypothetical protein
MPPSPPPSPERLYHLELRQFPHNMCRFNLSGEELRATVLERWAADKWVEVGERKWDPRHAKLTVLEGPRIPPERLSMGRGWRFAQRHSRDVTAQLLPIEDRPAAVALAPGVSDAPGPAVARGPAGGGEADRLGGSAPPGDPVGPDSPVRPDDLVSDALGLQLLARMGDEPTPLRYAWELASARDPGSSASEALAIAERAVASLLRARLVVLLRAAGTASTPEAIREEDAVAALRAPESWTGSQVWLRRA